MNRFVNKLPEPKLEKEEHPEAGPVIGTAAPVLDQKPIDRVPAEIPALQGT